MGDLFNPPAEQRSKGTARSPREHCERGDRSGGEGGEPPAPHEQEKKQGAAKPPCEALAFFSQRVTGGAGGKSRRSVGEEHRAAARIACRVGAEATTRPDCDDNHYVHERVLRSIGSDGH